MNISIFQYLNSFAGRADWLDTFIVFCAEWLPYWLVASLILFVILERKKIREMRMVLYVLDSAFTAYILTLVIRLFYVSPRPFIDNEVYRLVFHKATNSFPSAHASFFFALAMAVFLFPDIEGSSGHRKWSVLFFVGAILIGVSRIMAGIHWPLDILGGIILGCGTSYALYYLYQKFINSLLIKK